MNRRFLSSAFLQMLEKAVRLPISLVMSVLVANYLGASQFGALTVAYTIVIMGAPLASLGIDNIVYQKIGNNADPSETLSNAIFVKLVAFAGIYLILGLYAFTFAASELDRNMVLTLGLILLFSAFDPITTLQTVLGHGLAKTLIGLGAFLLFSLFRLYLIWTEAGLYLFSVAFLIEVITTAGLLAWWARRNGIRLRLRLVNPALIQGLLRAAFPLFLSHVMISIFTKIDILMIRHYLGDADVGQYAISIRLVEVISIFPAVLINALFPLAMTAKKTSQTDYMNIMQRILSYGYLMGLSGALLFFFFANLLVATLYSPEFSASANVLTVLCWASVFQFFGSFSTLWLVNEGLQRYRVYRVAAAMALNITLNSFWIPAYGIQGAAYATLISQFMGSILGNAFTSNTRPIFWLQLRVMLTFNLVKHR